MRHPAFADLRLLWHTQIGAIAAPFVPVFMGVREVPEEFRQHRYLTEAEAARFIDRVHHGRGAEGANSAVPQGIESTRSASAVFKRLLYLVSQHHESHLAEVTAIWEAVETRLRDAQGRAARAAEVLLEQGETELARDLLTYFTTTELMKALELAETLAAAIEARTRALHGIGSDLAPRGPEQLW